MDVDEKKEYLNASLSKRLSDIFIIDDVECENLQIFTTSILRNTSIDFSIGNYGINVELNTLHTILVETTDTISKLLLTNIDKTSNKLYFNFLDDIEKEKTSVKMMQLVDMLNYTSKDYTNPIVVTNSMYANLLCDYDINFKYYKDAHNISNLSVLLLGRSYNFDLYSIPLLPIQEGIIYIMEQPILKYNGDIYTEVTEFENVYRLELDTRISSSFDIEVTNPIEIKIHDIYYD